MHRPLPPRATIFRYPSLVQKVRQIKLLSVFLMGLFSPAPLMPFNAKVTQGLLQSQDYRLIMARLLDLQQLIELRRNKGVPV